MTAASQSVLSAQKSKKSDRDVHIILYHQAVAATAQVNSATEDLHSIMLDIPVPHPDRRQGVKNASNRLTAARKGMMKAYSRLNDFLSQGIVPEDLKRNG